MSKSTLYEFEPNTPPAIAREQYTNVGASTFQLGDIKRGFWGGAYFELWDAVSGGNQLVEGVDYTLENLDQFYTDRSAEDVYTGVKIINVTYQTGSIYATYRPVGTYISTGALNRRYTNVITADYAVQDNDNYDRIEIDLANATGDVTVTFPLMANNLGRRIEVEVISSHASGYKGILIDHASDAACITTDLLSMLWLPKKGDHITVQQSATAAAWVSVDERITSQLRLNTYAGYGSTDNKIMRFTNVIENVGNCFSENHASGYSSNAKGLEITINRSGRYSFWFQVHVSAGSPATGLSLNSAQLTTSIQSITDADRLASRFSSIAETEGVSCTLYLKKGDVVRPHTSGAAPAANNLCLFHAAYLG